jgi:ubiquinone/menaquinone biosynthesis C-methylase UbiE
MELLIDLHIHSERQGPGSKTETIKAFQLTGIMPNKDLKIADIGCGTGSQTRVLAELSQGSIIAVDLNSPFLNKLKDQLTNTKYQNRIQTLFSSMNSLPFHEDEFDLVWSEGAIYNMGFEAGIKNWKHFIKKNGFLVASELTWITGFRPMEIEDYWTKEYPEVDTISNKIKILESNGYSPIAHFVMPEYCWLENYYYPLLDQFPDFLKRNASNPRVQEIVELEKNEIDMYLKYKTYYSYVYYIAKKIE